jgi:hypothetical protein
MRSQAMKRNASKLYLALLASSAVSVALLVFGVPPLQPQSQQPSPKKPEPTAPKTSQPSPKPQTPAPNAAGAVWVNTDTGVYHKQGTRWYGKTKHGKYMLEADAIKAGYKPAK